MSELTRQEYNIKILKIIKETINKNPNLRFYQVLWGLALHKVDACYYEESEETYKDLTRDLEID